MNSLLLKIYTWSVDPNSKWRSWLFHGLVAIPMTLVFGASATTVFYLLRELEQYAHEYMNNIQPDHQDHFFDVLSPMLFGVVTEWLSR